MVVEELARDGYVFVHAAEMRALLTAAGSLSDWAAFAASWNTLELDHYMADGGRYRRRRHAVYAAAADGAIVRAAHQPHYQSRDYNALNGGIARWFEPIDGVVGSGATMQAILTASRAWFEALAGARDWQIEVHQFRIEARAGEAGRPTPEGVHRDGVDYVLVLLIDRQNIASGTTTVHALDRPRAGRVHPHRTARRGAAGRLEGRARGDADRAGRSGAPRVSRRAGRDLATRLIPWRLFLAVDHLRPEHASLISR